MRRYGDLAFRQSLHAWQMERLKLGKRLEVIPSGNATEKVLAQTKSSSKTAAQN